MPSPSFSLATTPLRSGKLYRYNQERTPPRASWPRRRSRRSSSGSTPSMSHAPSASLSRRRQIVREALTTRALDALVITTPSNVLYLTNFTGSSAIVVLTADGLHFVTDFRYVTAVSDMAGTAHRCPN